MDHKEFIGQMTLKEKAESTVLQDDMCFVTKRLGNKGFRIKDNPRGDIDYNVETPEERAQGYHPVALPQAAAQAASWDTDVAEQIGTVMGRECQIHDVNVLLRPGVNIKRSPLCGRNFEYYSEDPVLAGKMGGAFIRGVQSQGTAANLKHFAVNSQEYERMTTNAVISERPLREVYLKPFEIAIKEGDPWTIMTSYNRVNGHWVPANPDLMKLLRGEFGFDGTVISDAMAVQTEKVDSHRYGLDFEIGQVGSHSQELQEAVEQGVLPEAILDESMDRMLTLQERVAKRNLDSVDPSVDHALGRKLCAQTLVLLKNDGVLPIAQGAKVALIGKLAQEVNYMGCGSGHMNGWKIESVTEEMEKIGTAVISYAPAYNVADRPWNELAPDEALIDEALETAKDADVVVFFTGLPIGYETEGFDRASLALPSDQEAALEAILGLGKKTVLVNISGSAVDLTAFVDRVSGVLHAYSAGEALGGAIADVLTGVAEPGGRLPETFPMRLEDTPAYMNFPRYPMEMLDVHYGEGIFVGYRWYEARKIKTLFPFGAGLSYTSFAWSDVCTDADTYDKNGKITVSVTVKNTGNRRGSEVVQIYVGKKDSQFSSPVKELKGFAKVTLDPGEEKAVSIAFDVKDLAKWHERRHCWVVEGGAYQIYAAKNVDAVVSMTAALVSSPDRAHRFSGMDALEWYIKDDRMDEVLSTKSDGAKACLQIDESMKHLIQALPIYRMPEGSAFGLTPLTPQEMVQIEDELNQ